MPGAQGELRTFISHLHVCTFSINNVELKYVQSSLPTPRPSFPLAPSAKRCCLQNLASSHPSGFLGVQPVVPGTLLAPTTLFSHA